MKVLIICPSFKVLGGVANHYLGLMDYWSFDMRYEFYGRQKKIPASLTFGWDLLKFICKLIFKRPDIVIVNPSLRNYQLFRDGIYLQIAYFFRIPVVTFIHGWSDKYAEELLKKNHSFKRIYNKSDLIFVLAQEFKEKLEEIGITSPIELTTTKVNDQLLNDFKLSTRDGKIKEILFLARIVKEKGIFITIHAFSILQKKYPKLRLRVVGMGPDFERAKALVKELKLENVIFRGAIFGIEIAEEFKSSQIYVLPSSHGEGMPTSVLEAMAFGMPVITRPLGGLNDFFINSQMGELVHGLDPESYAAAIEEYISNTKKCADIAKFNHEYAVNRFFASSVARELESKIVSNLNYSPKNGQINH